MKTLHFGIEMEMTGITREKAANLMAGFFGTGRGTYEGGAYDTYTALDNQGRTCVFCQAKIPTFIMKIPHRHQGNFPTFSEDIRMRFSQPHPAA